MNKSNVSWVVLTLVLGGLVVGTSAYAADAVSSMPSEKAMADWDKNFHPGYYEVTDTPLDTEGQPIAKDSKTSKQCYSKQDIKAFARTPFTMVPAQHCQVKLELIPLNLTLSAHCTDEGKTLEVLSAVGVDQDHKEYNLATVKIEKLNSGGSEMTYGKGKRLKYLGTCP